MFTVQNGISGEEKQALPIHIWLPGLEWIEEGCLQQVRNLSLYPYAVKQVALMADVHQGFGMPIGGVMATKEVVVPNAVGVDIGCGVAFCETKVDMDRLGKSTLEKIVHTAMNRIPQGFSHHKTPRISNCVKAFMKENQEERCHPKIWSELDASFYQIGTLGGGNHFIEFQQNDEGKLCFMIHSGSRNIGYKIANYFNQIAQKNRKRWESKVPDKVELDCIPINSDEGQSYIKWMNLARDFARESRLHMMKALWQAFKEKENLVVEAPILDVHHNDVNRETHDGEILWVHRKGAVKASKEEKAIIPGAMGMSSYIVKGLANPMSFESCSHGAGRSMSRKQAKKQFGQQQVAAKLAEKQVILGKRKMNDIGEEAPEAYKDIEFVMEQQKDLVLPLQTLSGRVVIKG
ncbi:tRNA-splicing ligase RtcB [Tindallia magadiensis]|uniref:3'-phosphate/5'-hydroxy nucleic acid ligase n=1 Tax=Tindallia magadiensis TaxID=69895 RepID=A0A1I3FSN4_9FIRM|nr:RtcB family protein [Tindallia magadiensis]SFI14174.1 tRNA-splicing ligase RtcB [Tindallia magadiensis]